MKNRFKIFYHKAFHPFPPQAKIVHAWCILHNWILDWGLDEYVLEEDNATAMMLNMAMVRRHMTMKLERVKD